jgi:hypothetical protein
MARDKTSFMEELEYNVTQTSRDVSVDIYNIVT